MRQTFSILFTAIIAAIALSVLMVIALISASNAQAATAKWADVGNWTIYGNTDKSYCWASTVYEDGTGMSIGFHNNYADKREEVMWILTNVNAEENRTYEVIVKASNGSSGVMTAFGTSEKTVAFADLNKTAVMALANARSIYIQGLGRYNLKGSRAAMGKAWECFEVLNSY